MRPRKNNKKEVRNKKDYKNTKSKTTKEENELRHQVLISMYNDHNYSALFMEFYHFIINEIEKELVYYRLMDYASDMIHDMCVEFYHQLDLYKPEAFPGVHIQGYLNQRIKWKIMEKRNKLIKNLNREIPYDSNLFI